MSSEPSESARGRIKKPNELWCWMPFLFSAVFFVISALRSGDVPGLIGAFLFLMAFIVFLLPHLTRAFSAGRWGGEWK